MNLQLLLMKCKMYKNAYASAYHSDVKGTNTRAFPKFRTYPNFAVAWKKNKLDVISWAQDTSLGTATLLHKAESKSP
jgi:hypothetical protein